MDDREPDRGEVKDAAGFIRRAVPFGVNMAVILGSGLGGVRRVFRPIRAFSYSEIPHFPMATVRGHQGRLILGARGKSRAFIMDGRVHRYEGYTFSRVTFPMAVLHELGVSTVIVTNAAGSVGQKLGPGDIMLIVDHIDLMWKGVAPVEGGPQIWHRPYYSRRLTDLADKLAVELGISAKRGVLLATCGPSYETAAEVEFARKIGADAATMSTIPEVTVCHRLGMTVLGLSVITNVAPVSDKGGHEEVVALAGKGAADLARLILAVTQDLDGAT